MADYVTAHFYNPAPGREAALTDAFGAHVESVKRLRGFKSAQRFEVTKPQIMPHIPQPWRYLTLYEVSAEDPTIDVPPLAPLIANFRDAGLIADDEAERMHTFKMHHPWKYSRNYTSGPLDHVMLLLANFVPGREAEYHKWYDEAHSVEVGEAEGFVGMRRGGLSPVQLSPVSYCPGSQLILGGMQVGDRDLGFVCKDFADRAGGTSPSGVAWPERSSSASIARTVHLFKSIAGPFN
jgi:heme-degrading monooxygenase HmoA